MKTKTAVSCGVLTLMLVCCFEVKCETRPLEIYADLVSSTSNAWGRCVEEFENAAQSNMSVLVSVNTQESRILRERWLISLARMQVPTNDVLYAEWLKTKTMWLAGSGRRFSDAGATNLWFAISDVLGELRRNMKSESEILPGCFTSQSNSMISAASGCSEKLMSDFAFLDAQRDSARMLSRLIVDTFGLKGLGCVGGECRALVYSNLVERACLTSEEQNRIQRYVVLPE